MDLVPRHSGARAVTAPWRSHCGRGCASATPIRRCCLARTRSSGCAPPRFAPHESPRPLAATAPLGARGHPRANTDASTRRVSLTRSLPASRRAVDRHRERVRARVEGDRREAQVRRDTHARGGGRRHRRDLRGIQPGRRVRRARARARKKKRRDHREIVATTRRRRELRRHTVFSGEHSRKSRNARRSTFVSGGFVHVSRRENAGVQRRRAGDAFRRATRRASARAAAA